MASPLPAATARWSPPPAGRHRPLVAIAAVVAVALVAALALSGTIPADAA